jgi:glycogen phosphorylase
MTNTKEFAKQHLNFGKLKGKKVAYFSMEFAIDQALKTYSGGLGYLAGSHMRSAWELKQNLYGIGILWKYGYYDQERDSDNLMQANFRKKEYSFLVDTGIVFPVTVHNHPVQVKAYFLPPHIFNCAPMFFLTTDIPENDYLSRTITHKLYDSNIQTKIAQSIILGIGGGKLLDILDQAPEIYHLNEGHALPLAFYLYEKHRSLEKLKKQFVFTTHTPEAAGNEAHDFNLLNTMSFFNGLPENEAREITRVYEGDLNYTLTALRFAKISNGVSKVHETVANDMWKGNEGISKITSITNAQSKTYWMDQKLEKALNDKDDEAFILRKKEMKKELFKLVADQTGKIFDENVFTIVWARRFAAYKRADLMLRDFERFMRLVNSTDFPVQIIWAGKPYPGDCGAITTFNHIIKTTAKIKNCAVVTGYELNLSGLLKKGSDLWLNTPTFPREASGTSGMSAAMNGSVNFSIPDGWIPEFVKHGKNGFLIPSKVNEDKNQQDIEDYTNLYNTLENEILPLYYKKPKEWLKIMKTAMSEVVPQFGSDRMATEYYDKIYNH